MEKKEIANLINIVEKFETAMLKSITSTEYRKNAEFRKWQLDNWRILKNEFRYSQPNLFDAYSIMQDGLKGFSYSRSFSKEERQLILTLMEEDCESVKKAYTRLQETGRNSYNEKNDYPGGKEEDLASYSKLSELEEQEIRIIKKLDNPVLRLFYKKELTTEIAFLVYCIAKKNKVEMQANMAVVEAIKNPGKPQDPTEIDLLEVEDAEKYADQQINLEDLKEQIRG